MTPEEMRGMASELFSDSYDADDDAWRRSILGRGVAYRLAAEICERLDILIAATGTRSLPIVGEIGGSNADSE